MSLEYSCKHIYKIYEYKAKQGRDEPPAEQCRMGVSMGYPPLTQKFLVLKKIMLWKNLVKSPISILLIWCIVIALYLRIFYLTYLLVYNTHFCSFLKHLMFFMETYLHIKSIYIIFALD